MWFHFTRIVCQQMIEISSGMIIMQLNVFKFLIPWSFKNAAWTKRIPHDQLELYQVSESGVRSGQ